MIDIIIFFSTLFLIGFLLNLLEEDKIKNKGQIKGLIEVTLKTNEKKILLNPLNYDFLDCGDHCIVDTPNNNQSFFLISETYDQVKELIKKSQ